MARRSNFELMLILNSLGAYFFILAVAYVFGNAFGEAAMSAMEMMLKLTWIPATTLLLGIGLFIWRKIYLQR